MIKKKVLTSGCFKNAEIFLILVVFKGTMYLSFWEQKTCLSYLDIALLLPILEVP